MSDTPALKARFIRMSRAFSAGALRRRFPGALRQAGMKAPLALNSSPGGHQRESFHLAHRNARRKYLSTDSLSEANAPKPMEQIHSTLLRQLQAVSAT